MTEECEEWVMGTTSWSLSGSHYSVTCLTTNHTLPITTHLILLTMGVDQTGNTIVLKHVSVRPTRRARDWADSRARVPRSST